MFRKLWERHSPRGLRAPISLSHDVLLGNMRLREPSHMHYMYRARDPLNHSKGLDTPSRMDKPTLVWACTNLSSTDINRHACAEININQDKS